jgi:hypothetical protein
MKLKPIVRTIALIIVMLFGFYICISSAVRLLH